ncbi:MAG: hypothetical protein PHE02_03630 [Lachnospiraceae bacterium]|nr:hypothetical protein [Lachnospiraceae bacterium]
MSILNDEAIPMGFGMALSQNLSALNRFSAMSESEKEELLNRARDARSKSDMSALVDELSHYEGLM